MDKWRSEGFEQFQTGVDVEKVVERFQFLFGEVELSQQEKEALTNAVVDFVSSYQIGSFESITKWRIPVRGYSFVQGVSNVMAKRFSIPPSTIQNNPAEAWKIWWYGTSKGLWYSNMWTGISITNCEVRVERKTVIPDKLLAVLNETKTENVSYAWRSPTIIFQSSPEQILASAGSIDYAVIRVLPKTKDDDAIYPVYLRSCWSPEEKKWLPESMVWSYSRADRKYEPFF